MFSDGDETVPEMNMSSYILDLCLSLLLPLFYVVFYVSRMGISTLGTRLFRRPWPSKYCGPYPNSPGPRP